MFASFLGEDDVCDYYSSDYDLEQCKTLKLQSQCKTQDGTLCVFPFIFRGQKVTKCITGAIRTQPWCPTQVDSQGIPVPGYWGHCDDQCSTDLSDLGMS